MSQLVLTINDIKYDPVTVKSVVVQLKLWVTVDLNYQSSVETCLSMVHT